MGFTNDVEKALMSILLDQPYEVCCSECGNSLVITGRTPDPDGDLRVKVAPCIYCMDDAREEGRNES